MSQQPTKIARTLLEKLEALDDHLFLLRDALHNLAHDDARLKALASELRVLICKSSGTEGLLWRLTQEVQVRDLVCIHVPGKADLSHPLSQGLQFMFSPLHRGGKGHPGRPVEDISFKLLVREYPAIFVMGENITHENLIRLVSEKIGSSHEDEFITANLQFLRQILINNQPSFFDALSRDAEFTLEVGERVIAKAVSDYSFTRKQRAGYGDFSITISARLNAVISSPIDIASFEFTLSKTLLKIMVTETKVIYQFTRVGLAVATVEAALSDGWKPSESAVFCLSYSSYHQKARVIVSGMAMPEVAAPLGFMDIREAAPVALDDSEVLSKQLMLTHQRLLRADEIERLTQSEPPYFDGLFKPDDAEASASVFP